MPAAKCEKCRVAQTAYRFAGIAELAENILLDGLNHCAGQSVVELAEKQRLLRLGERGFVVADAACGEELFADAELIFERAVLLLYANHRGKAADHCVFERARHRLKLRGIDAGEIFLTAGVNDLGVSLAVFLNRLKVDTRRTAAVVADAPEHETPLAGIAGGGDFL